MGWVSCWGARYKWHCHRAAAQVTTEWTRLGVAFTRQLARLRS
jgi:hypothetical protein